MTTTIVSGYRSRLAGHLRAALRAVENGEASYRVSTVSERGAPTDLVFEVHPGMHENRDSHLRVQHVSDIMAGRPAEWVAGESLR